MFINNHTPRYGAPKPEPRSNPTPSENNQEAQPQPQEPKDEAPWPHDPALDHVLNPEFILGPLC